MHLKCSIIILLFSLLSFVAYGQDLEDFKNKINPVNLTPKWLNMCKYDIDFQENYMFIVGAFEGMYIYDVSDPSKPLWVNSVNKFLGYNICVNDGYAYIQNGFKELLIVDVDPVKDSQIIGRIRLDKSIHDIIAADSNCVYLSTFAEKGKVCMIIINVSSKEKPIIISETYFDFGLENSKLDRNRIYMCNYRKGFVVIDVSDKKNPQIGQTINLDSITEVDNIDKHDKGGKGIILNDGYLYCGFDDKGFAIIDLNYEDEPSLVKMVDTKNPANVLGMADKKYLLVGDLKSEISVYDISDPTNPAIINTETMPFSIMRCWVNENVIYLFSYDSDMLITKIVSKGELEELKRFSSLIGIESACYDEKYIYVYSSYTGLNIIDIKKPAEPSVGNVSNDIKEISNMRVCGSKLFTLDNSGGKFKIYDISSLDKIMLIKEIEGPTSYHSCFVILGDYAYLNSTEGIIAVDINPAVLAFAASVTPEYQGEFMFAYANDLILVSKNKIYLLGISNPLKPEAKQVLDVNDQIRGAYMAENYLFVSVGYGEEKGMIVLINPLKGLEIVKETDFSFEKATIGDDLIFLFGSGGWSVFDSQKFLSNEKSDIEDCLFWAETMAGSDVVDIIYKENIALIIDYGGLNVYDFRKCVK